MKKLLFILAVPILFTGCSLDVNKDGRVDETDLAYAISLLE